MTVKHAILWYEYELLLLVSNVRTMSTADLRGVGHATLARARLLLQNATGGAGAGTGTGRGRFLRKKHSPQELQPVDVVCRNAVNVDDPPPGLVTYQDTMNDPNRVNRMLTQHTTLTPRDTDITVQCGSVQTRALCF